MSAAEDALAAELDALGLAFNREVRFHPERRWRFDFCRGHVAVEVEGRGRHQTFIGFRNDCEKYNEAARLGWLVLRFPAADYKPSKSRKVWPRGAADWAAFVKQVVETRT